MGDMGDIWNELKAERAERRAKLGVSCPECNIKQPKRIPTILLPRQRCKVCGYRDPRPRESNDGGQARKSDERCPAPTGSATYLPVKCIECGWKDSIRADYYRPRGGEFWCDECGGGQEYEPDLSPNEKLTGAGGKTTKD